MKKNNLWKFRKNKLRLKFFFFTNFHPSFKYRNSSRYHFCRNFYLFVYFITFFIAKRYQKINNQIKYQLYHLVSNKKIVPRKINGMFVDLVPITNTWNLTNIPDLTVAKNKKSYSKLLNVLNINHIFYTNKKVVLQNKPKFHFVIFTKVFSHFVILRAPFRDKISKNLVCHHRFFVYLNFTYDNLNPYLFFEKFYLIHFLNSFQKLFLFTSNILFLHSKKFTFFFFYPNLFDKFI